MKILVASIVVVCVIFMMSAAALMVFNGNGKDAENEPQLPVTTRPTAEEITAYEHELLLELAPGPVYMPAEIPEPEPEPEKIPEPEITIETFIPVPERCELLQSLVTQRAETPRGAEYFDNAIFIGDSITTGYRIWQPHITIGGETLENTFIFANGSYGIYNALQDVSGRSIHPELDGVQMSPEDAVAASGAERVFIDLGLNDVLYPLDTFLHNYRLLVNRILARNPDVEVIFLPVPPYMHEAQPSPDRNARIAEYNNALIVLAHEMGLAFIDSTAPLRCENDGLKEQFCGDPPPAGQGCHWVPGAYNEVLRWIAEHPG